MNKFIFLFIATLLFMQCSSDNEEKIYNEAEKEEEVPEVELDSTENKGSNLYYEEMEVEYFYYDSLNAINVVFVGEAFNKESLLKSSSEYRKAAIECYEDLFSFAPFDQFKTEFNYCIVYASGTPRETAFNYQGSPTSEMNSIKLEEYVGKATGKNGYAPSTLVLFGVNKTVNGYGGNKIAYFPIGKPKVMMHEVGHAFGDLADEYSYGQERPYDRDIRFPNVDKTNDSSLIKWNRYFGITGYGEIGIFEGGYYRDSLIWRPSVNSIMRDTKIDSLGFNAVGREAIVREIYDLNGKTLSFEEFLEIDKPNIR